MNRGPRHNRTPVNNRLARAWALRAAHNRHLTGYSSSKGKPRPKAAGGLSSRKQHNARQQGGDLSPEESVFCLRGHAQVSILMTRSAAAFSPLFLL
jgi:hypothetical protein